MQDKDRALKAQEAFRTTYFKNKAKSDQLSVCIKCGKPRDGRFTRCFDCRHEGSAACKARSIKRKSEGICPQCVSPKLPSITLCQKCWFSQLAGNAGDRKIAEAIAALWHKQEGKCAYTGEVLIPGVNASLDHKIPKHMGGDNRIDNLQWTTKQINLHTKRWMSHDQFITMCSNVVHKFQVDLTAKDTLAEETSEIDEFAEVV